MEIEAIFDRWVYARRLEDSKRHCTQLLRYLPSSNRRKAQRDSVVAESFSISETANIDDLDRSDFSDAGLQYMRKLKMLQELNEEDYGVFKSIKKASPLEEIRKKNQELERRMHMILDTHQISESKKNTDEKFHKQLFEQSKKRDEDQFPRDLKYKFQHEEEIKELEGNELPTILALQRDYVLFR
uniref:AlNc14C1296G12875 protein n=1 Tax=Albugo laibachii Nc14 TaxID=890382 RepID=F0X2M4_9STRA|nr:AlNc14C1296G12875 [Albugo laibachii Nc14]|eukprot:CCA28140.1 AlNc14C1296G12875 [Albugo laibachii Nc14]